MQIFGVAMQLGIVLFGVAQLGIPPPPKKLERKPTEDINASAEAFIRKFKQQLHLQRLESLENFEQMLKRGA
ncbi:hypothetical protein SASPL_118833 [Salvia splendens]|uniref:Uncharacterized protein n=1 Tax=Salvia splendens TaxID=180675 RepID=A0A8X8ZXL2_SALSN|nr:hypothetical protein SASPL_118833 [Salvia splendens]